jgi:hypothetical protein
MPDEIIALNRNARPVEIRGTGIVFRAPGLVGRVFYRGLQTEAEVRTAASRTEPDPLDIGLAEVGGLEVHQLEISAPTPSVTRAENTRAGEGDLQLDEFEADFPAKDDEYSFVIYRDEDGVTSIHFPSLAAPGETMTTRAAGQEQVFRYRLQLRPALGWEPRETNVRGWGLASKVIKFVVGKVAVRPAGLAIYGAVWAWERKARSFEGLHGGADLGALLAEQPAPYTDWKSLENHRSLLFVHGTTSTTDGAFAELKNFGTVAGQLYSAYGNRVVGFNHHTLTKRVARNAIEFYSQFPKNSGPYEFDVICHSRGGLVARAIKELTPLEIVRLTGEDGWQPPVQVKINRIAFVGTPNNGTDLADPNNIPKTLNRLANIATLIPGAGLSIAGVLSWTAFIAEAGFKSLPGLVDQCPGSDLLLALNHPSPSTSVSPTDDYFAIQSNYEPGKDSSLGKAILDHAGNAVVDFLFHNDRNDLVVPTLGVSKIDEGQLDSKRVKYFGQIQKDNVAHTRFFCEQDTWSHVLRSLGVAASS